MELQWIVKVKDSINGEFEGPKQNFQVTMKMEGIDVFPYFDSF